MKVRSCEAATESHCFVFVIGYEGGSLVVSMVQVGVLVFIILYLCFNHGLLGMLLSRFWVLITETCVWRVIGFRKENFRTLCHFSRPGGAMYTLLAIECRMPTPPIGFLTAACSATQHLILEAGFESSMASASYYVRETLMLKESNRMGGLEDRFPTQLKSTSHSMG